MNNSRDNVNEGWARAGRANSWPSSIRRHYFRNGLTLCRKYGITDIMQSGPLEDPKDRKPVIDCVPCTVRLDKEERLHIRGGGLSHPKQQVLRWITSPAPARGRRNL